jgi:hypothetical protein
LPCVVVEEREERSAGGNTQGTPRQSVSGGTPWLFFAGNYGGSEKLSRAGPGHWH